MVLRMMTRTTSTIFTQEEYCFLGDAKKVSYSLRVFTVAIFCSK